jgi:hypothetical protein
MHGLRASVGIGVIALIICWPGPASQAQPMIRLNVSEEIARQGNQVPITIEIENLGDSISAFQLGLTLSRPDLIVFHADSLYDTCYRCSDEACTAVVAYPCTLLSVPLSVAGTLTENWDYLEARTYGQYDLRITGISDTDFRDGIKPIPPFTNGILLKALAEVYCEIPYVLEDRTVYATISPLNTFFSNPHGELIEPLELTEGAVTVGYTDVGDMNGDHSFDPLDLNRLIDLLFANAPDPCPACVADMNCDGFPDPLDLTLMIDYMLALGVPPPQCPGCG